MAKIWKRLVLGVTLVAFVAGLALVLTKQQRSDSAADTFAQLPARERNLAVFDAACALMEKNYYHSEFFSEPKWSRQKASWREKAATVAAPLLYLNVLNNFALTFSSSHVGFIPPPLAQTQEQKKPSSPLAPDAKGQDLRIAAFESGPGYDTADIYRSNQVLTIVDYVQRGSPAERAGVQPGWLQDAFSKNLTPEGVHFSATYFRFEPEQVRGMEKAGLQPDVKTQEQLVAFMAAHTVQLDFSLEKLPAPPPDFETRQLPRDITYLRFDGFDGGGPAGKAMEVIDGAGPGGIILDLRRNHGGRQLEMMRVAGRLLGDDAVLGYTRKADNFTSPIRALTLGGHYEGPVIVLIGPMTASAGEIIAAAVQDYRRGKLIGRSTSGAVLSSEKFDLPDGGTLILPVKDFVRADDRRIEGTGVEPDIWILPTLEDVRAGRDPVLERALQELTPTT